MITANDFAQTYSELYGVPSKYARYDCDKFWKLFSKLLYEDKNNITIYGIGSFRHITKMERKVRHPGTGEIITIPEQNVVKFIQATNR